MRPSLAGYHAFELRHAQSPAAHDSAAYRTPVLDLKECPMTFDVFGRLLQIERHQNGWLALRPGNDGKRRPSSLAIPNFIQEHELVQYLTDIFHENASPRHPEVLRLK